MPEEEQIRPAGEEAPDPVPHDSSDETSSPPLEETLPRGNTDGTRKPALPVMEIALCAAILLAGTGTILTLITLVEGQRAGAMAGMAMIALGLGLATAAAVISRRKFAAIGCALTSLVILAGTAAVVARMPGSIPDLLPYGTEAALILDTAAIREQRDHFPGDYHDFLDGLQEELTGSLATVEIEAVTTDLYILATLEGEQRSLTIAQGGLIQGYIADDWEDQAFQQDSYRGRPVWDGAGARHTLLEDHGAVAASRSQGAVNTLLRTAQGDLPNLADAGQIPMRVLLDAVGNSPARGAATGGDIARLCLLPLRGCEGFAVAYDSFDEQTAETRVRAAVLFSSPRRALRAYESYDEAEAFLKAALGLLANHASPELGLLPAGTITVNSLEQKDSLLLATITVEEERYGHSGPTPEANR